MPPSASTRRTHADLDDKRRGGANQRDLLILRALLPPSPLHSYAMPSQRRDRGPRDDDRHRSLPSERGRRNPRHGDPDESGPEATTTTAAAAGAAAAASSQNNGGSGAQKRSPHNEEIQQHAATLTDRPSCTMPSKGDGPEVRDPKRPRLHPGGEGSVGLNRCGAQAYGQMATMTTESPSNSNHVGHVRLAQETGAVTTDFASSGRERLYKEYRALVDGLTEPFFPSQRAENQAAASFEGNAQQNATLAGPAASMQSNDTVPTIMDARSVAAGASISAKVPHLTSADSAVVVLNSSMPPRTAFLPTASQISVSAPAPHPHDFAPDRLDADAPNGIIPNLLKREIEEKLKVQAEREMLKTENALLRDANAKLQTTVQTKDGQLKEAKVELEQVRATNASLASRVQELEGLLNEPDPNVLAIQAENERLRDELAKEKHEHAQTKKRARAYYDGEDIESGEVAGAAV
jgi:hypothetical protein